MAAAKQAAIAGAEKYAINAREFVKMSTKMGEEAGERTGIGQGSISPTHWRKAQMRR